MENDNAPDSTPRANRWLTGSGETLPVASLAPPHPLSAPPQVASSIPGAQTRAQPDEPLTTGQGKGKGKARSASPAREHDHTTSSTRNLVYAPGPSRTRGASALNKAEADPLRSHNAHGMEGGPPDRMDVPRAGNKVPLSNTESNGTSSSVGSTTVNMATRMISGLNHFDNHRLPISNIQALQVPGNLLADFAVLKPGTRVKIDLHAGLERVGGVTLAIDTVENGKRELQVQALVTAPASGAQPVQGWKSMIQNEARA